ncbi:MAG TPA: sulfur carrier protein ThiS [Dyadobacter sp.]|jgi:sulfur carrier protein|nr:sulfur carrier protein ThiS [Dyadobacter sp.]
MEISINQQVTEIPENVSVQKLLTSLFANPSKGIAVAINQSIIPKSQWDRHILLADDKITLIRATQGG